MTTSDPILYPAPVGTLEGLRQEAARTRADLARTVEELADRVTPRRLVQPKRTVPVAGGILAAVAGYVVLRQIRAVRELAWVGGLAAAVAALAAARLVTSRPRRIVPDVGPVAVRKLETTAEVDVVSVLLEQHRRIDAAFTTVLRASGHDRVEAFAALVELVRHHETAEQDSVHPALRSLVGGIAEARVAEEHAADRALASLISTGVDDPGFDDGLRRLQMMVREHAEHEESREFPLLRAHLSATRRREMAGQVRWSP